MTQDDYKRKYKRLKRAVKQQVFLNAALCDEIATLEQHFTRTKAERKFLLKKLFVHLPLSEVQVLQSTKALDALERSNPGTVPHSILSTVRPGEENQLAAIRRKDKKFNKSTVSLAPSNNMGAFNATSKQQQTSMEESCEKSHHMQVESEAKPKRKRPGTAVKKVLPLHLDNRGVPFFPITLGTLCVYDLGEIVCDRPGFNSERYIWPVGYCSSRVYPSMLDPNRRIPYFCYIKDGGADPLFTITPEDEPDNSISAVTATACHCVLLKRLNKARGKDATNTGSGPEFFGFSHPTIQFLIQSLPGASECNKYQAQKFELANSLQLPKHTSNSNVIHEDNLPMMNNYERASLQIPQPKCFPGS